MRMRNLEISWVDFVGKSFSEVIQRLGAFCAKRLGATKINELYNSFICSPDGATGLSPMVRKSLRLGILTNK